jgi:hypothetical protein
LDWVGFSTREIKSVMNSLVYSFKDGTVYHANINQLVLLSIVEYECHP